MASRRRDISSARGVPSSGNCISDSFGSDGEHGIRGAGNKEHGDLPHLNGYPTKSVASKVGLPKGGQRDPGDIARVRGYAETALPSGQEEGEEPDPGRVLPDGGVAPEGGDQALGQGSWAGCSAQRTGGRSGTDRK